MADSVNSGETDTENSHHNVPQRQPSKSQLSAPYIEEVQPERPQYVRNPTADQTLDASDTALLNPPQVPEAQSNRSTSLRDYFRKSFFSSPFDVPYLWAKTDYKGRKAPPVLFSALKLAVTDSYHDEKNYNLQNVFRIELEYGDVKWVINRSGFDFASLYVSLKKEINLPHIPRLPTGLANWF
ncbi:unnamed protein product [Rhizophagus irregularis]|nr:unnamed protein product [Rhizophagus irregularis]